MPTKHHTLVGIGGNVELGKAGPRIKANGLAVEHRTSNDFDWVVGRGADPVADQDFVTKGWLGPHTTFGVTAQRELVATNIYLSVGRVPMNLAGFVVPFDSNIFSIAASCYGPQTWVAEVRKNDVLTPITSISLVNQETAWMALNVDVFAGDELQLYCNGASISRPVVSILVGKR